MDDYNMLLDNTIYEYHVEISERGDIVVEQRLINVSAGPKFDDVSNPTSVHNSEITTLTGKKNTIFTFLIAHQQHFLS